MWDTTPRDPRLDYKEYMEFNNPNCKRKTAITKTMKQRGLNPNVQSPFWDLPIFRRNLYKHFALDYLHVEPEGNWGRHFLYLVYKYGTEFTEGMTGTS